MFAIGFRGLCTQVLLCDSRSLILPGGGGGGPEPDPLSFLSIDSSTKQLYFVHTFKSYVVFCEIYAFLILMS